MAARSGAAPAVQRMLAYLLHIMLPACGQGEMRAVM